jgi:tetratricopeptide (TPR) repeat protein
MGVRTGMRGRVLNLAGLLLGVSIAAALPGNSAPGQTANEWVGKRVVEKFSNFALRIDNQVVERSQMEIHIYRVEQFNNGRLRLKAEGVGLAGWATVNDVVPVDDAIDFFTDQIRANPNDVFSYIMRALIWSDVKKELDIALGDLNEALRLDPKLALAYSNRGIVWAYKQEYDKAVADHSEAIRLDPKYALAYNNRGTAWWDKQEYDKAVADYSEAIRLDPKDAWAYNARAWLWAMCPDAKHRDGQQAVESAKRACELTDQKDPDKLGTLAASYAEAGDFDAAVRTQETAIDLLTDVETKKDYGSRLDLYRARKPYREKIP